MMIQAMVQAVQDGTTIDSGVYYDDSGLYYDGSGCCHDGSRVQAGCTMVARCCSGWLHDVIAMV